MYETLETRYCWQCWRPSRFRKKRPPTHSAPIKIVYRPVRVPSVRVPPVVVPQALVAHNGATSVVMETTAMGATAVSGSHRGDT